MRQEVYFDLQCNAAKGLLCQYYGFDENFFIWRMMLIYERE
jgi:hypothetical protein